MNETPTRREIRIEKQRASVADFYRRYQRCHSVKPSRQLEIVYLLPRVGARRALAVIRKTQSQLASAAGVGNRAHCRELYRGLRFA